MHAGLSPNSFRQNKKRKRKFSGFVLWQFHLCYSFSSFLVLAVNVIAHKVTTAIATAAETRATLPELWHCGGGGRQLSPLLITDTVPLPEFVTSTFPFKFLKVDQQTNCNRKDQQNSCTYYDRYANYKEMYYF